MIKPGNSQNKILIGAIAVTCFLLAGFLFVVQNKISWAQTNSSDAIAIRILPNQEHLSALAWYKKQGFTGSPQSLTVDGYEAVRDGRTVYVDVANIISGQTNNTLYTNIYLISYNQNAEKETVDIFSQILGHWKFNSNILSAGHCRKDIATVCLEDDECKLGDFCDSLKARVTRDTKRLADIAAIKAIMVNFQKAKGYYPKLNAGTYLSQRSLSVWPSWQAELNKEVGATMPTDPINKIGVCSGFDEKTCWDDTTKKFVTNLPTLPSGSLLYYYSSINNGTNYDICTTFESGASFAGTTVCSLAVCLDFDGDGYGNPPSSACAHSEQDCNDSDPNINVPSAEICNDGIDNDCDGFIDCNDADCSSNSTCTAISGCNNNGTCDPGEDCNTCPADCGVCLPTCGDGVCDASCDECNNCYGPGKDCNCGDNVICTFRGEECDDGPNNGTATSNCTSDCKLKTCLTPCPLDGQTICTTGTQGRQICQTNGSGCRQWVDANCLGTNICQNGQCVVPCSNDPDCNPPTSLGCNDASNSNYHVRWNCQQNAYGCWLKNYINCGVDVCDPSTYQCVPAGPTCTNQCTTAGNTCNGNVVSVCADTNGDTCFELINTTCSGATPVCNNGICEACSNQCTTGQRECTGGNAYRQCTSDANGCRIWGSQQNCPGTQACTGAGVCTTPCTNQCTTAGSTCNSNVASVCADTNGDSCFELTTTTCSGATPICSNGSCIACTNQCAAGQCVGAASAGIYQLCNTDANGCRIWGSQQNCPLGQNCTGAGICTCNDQCAAGQCVGAASAGIYQLCNTDANGCRIWGPQQNCPSGQNCTGAGVCAVPSCAFTFTFPCNFP